MRKQSAPRLLILETSGRTGAVALAEGGDLLAERTLEQSQKQARDLAPKLSEMLQEQGWRARDLHAVIVSLGPGSYTGLRVGVMSAKTLCYAIDALVIGIETFQAVALQAPDEAVKVDVLADAQQGRVYVQSFQRSQGGSGWEAVTSLAIRPLEDWLPQRDQEAWVSGPGVDKHLVHLSAGLPLVSTEQRQPRPQSLLTLGLRRYHEENVSDLWKIEPIYLRPSAAEEQWERRWK